MRAGELAALRRQDIDADTATVRVRRQLTAVNSSLTFGHHAHHSHYEGTIAIPGVLAGGLACSLAAPAPHQLPPYRFLKSIAEMRLSWSIDGRPAIDYAFGRGNIAENQQFWGTRTVMDVIRLGLRNSHAHT